MPPKKKVERAATENISLGPQVREGLSFPLEPYSEEEREKGGTFSADLWNR